ncbi:TIR domain-containing protein [Tenacibaculum sp. 190130A14a]|uniref:TIR-like domain-containing protein n=1 Tax=Tenacibaculum polynesiense TaxID=3137857 RepID=A0ABM9PG83_9FLAO
MTLDNLKSLLTEKGYSINSEKEVTHGQQIKMSNGATITCFKNGKIQVQGKAEIKSEMESAIGLSNPNSNVKITAELVGNKSNEVFVVYGHDKEARDQLEAMLRRWGLEPLILDQLPSEGQTIIEKLENYTRRCEFGIVLATPDDEGFRKNHPDEKAFRARQNVVLEMGMLLSKLGRDRVAVLLKSQTEMERPSDIQGLIYISFKDNVAEAKLTLAKEMATKGYNIDIQKI